MFSQSDFNSDNNHGETLLRPLAERESNGRLSGESGGAQTNEQSQYNKSESSYILSVKPARALSRDRKRAGANDDDYYAAPTSDGDLSKLGGLTNFDGMSDDQKIMAKQKLANMDSHASQSGVKKMGTVKTYFAVMKAYCAINVLLLPRSFVNGGYLLSPMAMAVAVFFESLCAVRLTTVAHKYGIFSYPLLMQEALGKKGLYISRVVLALAHWQFTIGQLTFTLTSLQSTFEAWIGVETPLWVFGICIWLCYSPLVWVRRLESFSQMFIFAVAMILLGVLTTSVFAFRLIDEQGGSGPEIVSVNENSYWSMIGFAFFMFEGIGCLLPVMRETKEPEKMPQITVAAIATLCFFYVLFSELCYYAWGSNLTEPVVTEMLPADNTFVQIMKLLFCMNLVFSFPLTIVPTCDTLEAWILNKKESQKIEDENQTLPLGASVDDQTQTDSETSIRASEISIGVQDGESTALYWKINALRSMLVLMTVVIVILVADKLDKFISVAGAIFGMTNVLLLPALCHLKLVADTKGQRCFDIFVIVFACIMLVFGPATIISQW